MNKYQIICEAGGERIDKFVKIDGISRTRLQALANDHLITVNQKPVKPNYILAAGDVIEVSVPPAKALDILPEAIPLEIVYEDASLLVVNKPQGMVVHPAAGNYSGTLVNALLHHCGDELSGIGGVARPGIVHRIDKDTSGLLVVAKTDAAHQSLAEQIQKKTVTREYECVVSGVVALDRGTVDAPIGRHPTDRKKMAVVSTNSKRAVTHFTVLERFVSYTYLQCRLETGRTHQIRVHMKYMGHPVVGDPLYSAGKNRFGLKGQALHAKKLGFVHPETGNYMEFESPLPGYFAGLLLKLRMEDQKG